MRTDKLVAKSEITITADAAKVWHALTNARLARHYMFGAQVVTDWKEGSSILWKGEWKGQTFEDKGTILKVVPFSLLKYSHFSPLSGKADLPENYHTVSIFISADGGHTKVTLEQDGNESTAAKQHSEQNWNAALANLKRVVEEL
jgi:uncharacterized protein YndB with AHSA1/START domain